MQLLNSHPPWLVLLATLTAASRLNRRRVRPGRAKHRGRRRPASSSEQASSRIEDGTPHTSKVWIPTVVAVESFRNNPLQYPKPKCAQ